MFYGLRLLRLSDVSVILLCFILGQLPRLHEFSWSLNTWWHLEGQFRVYGLALILFGFLFTFGFLYQHYTERKPFWDELRESLKVLSLLMILDAAFFFFNKIHFSRAAFAIQWFAIFCLLPTFRTLVKLYALKIGTWQIPVRLIGNGENAKEAWLALKSEGLMGYELAEVVQTSHISLDGSWITVPQLSWQEGLKPSRNMQVVVALEAEQQAELDEVVRVLSRFYPNMIIVPPTRGLPLWGMQPLHSFSHEVLLLRAQNSLLRPSARLIKRAFDVFVSLTLLLLLSPLFAYLFYKVKQTEGDAFFGAALPLSAQRAPLRELGGPARRGAGGARDRAGGDGRARFATAVQRRLRGGAAVLAGSGRDRAAGGALAGCRGAAARRAA